MKVYQCAHKYPPHIPQFEKKHKDILHDLSFDELRNLLIDDGYLSTYILKPAMEKKSDEVFYTIWNYKTLQLKWARENGLKTNNLDEIKLTQIEEFKPDVFYNHSPYYDGDFVNKLLNHKEIIKVCWDAIIMNNPSLHENYDLRFTLFEPFVKYWNQCGLASYILSPAFAPSWDNLDIEQKDTDIIFYGQYLDYFFSERNKMLQYLTKWSNEKGINFKLHLQLPNRRKPLINTRGFSRLTRWLPVAPKLIRKKSLPPVYGEDLYKTIARSKIVVNAFGNYNGLYKDNMRNYESIGCGAFLVSENGIYPDHFIPGKDFYTYRSNLEMIEKIEKILSLPDQGFNMAKKTRKKLRLVYSKDSQWNNFTNAINKL